MQDTISVYFDGEKSAGVLIAAIGVAILALAAMFYPPRMGLRSFAVTLAVFALKSRFVLSGIALGLLCHAAFLLAFDLVAERRGAIYLEALRTRSAALAAPVSASAADIHATRANPV